MENKEIDPQEALKLTVAAIASNFEKVGDTIVGFTSAKLKRVLKVITHASLAEEIITGKKLELEEDEKKIIDKIFLLQEDVLGYIQLKTELEGENDEQMD